MKLRMKVETVVTLCWGGSGVEEFPDRPLVFHKIEEPSRKFALLGKVIHEQRTGCWRYSGKENSSSRDHGVSTSPRKDGAEMLLVDAVLAAQLTGRRTQEMQWQTSKMYRNKYTKCLRGRAN